MLICTVYNTTVVSCNFYNIRIIKFILFLYVQLDSGIKNNDNVALQPCCISHEISKQLAGLCIQVEDVFGSPQDIEWAAVKV